MNLSLSYVPVGISLIQYKGEYMFFSHASGQMLASKVIFTLPHITKFKEYSITTIKNETFVNASIEIFHNYVNKYQFAKNQKYIWLVLFIFPVFNYSYNSILLMNKELISAVIICLSVYLHTKEQNALKGHCIISNKHIFNVIISIFNTFI